MEGELLLITGVTGHIGFHTLLTALEAGYRVHAPLRSLSQAGKLLANSYLQALNPGDRLRFLEVPDITVPGAYDVAIQGCAAAIHLASPRGSSWTGKDGDLASYFIDPVTKSTVGLLESAKKCGTVRKIVLGSAIFALMSDQDFVSGKCETIFDASSRTSFVEPPYDTPRKAYSAGKIKALSDSEEWLEREKPNFDVVHVFLSFAIGGNKLNNSTLEEAMLHNGPSIVVLKTITHGNDAPVIPTASVHVDDVARAMVVLLDRKIQGNQGLILKSGDVEGIKWEDAKAIVNKHFNVMVQNGVLKNSGKLESAPLKLDVGPTVEILGFRFLNFEEQIKSLVSWYLNLSPARL